MSHTRRREAFEWLDRELSAAAKRRRINPKSLQPFIDACAAVATFLEQGGVVDDRLELILTIAIGLIEARDNKASRLFTPSGAGKGDRGLTAEQARARAWAGCASIALSAEGKQAAEADRRAAEATDWIGKDEERGDRTGGPFSAETVKKARLRVAANHDDDLVAQLARGVAEVAALVPAEQRATWLLLQLAPAGHAYSL